MAGNIAVVVHVDELQLQSALFLLLLADKLEEIDAGLFLIFSNEEDGE